MGEKENRTQTPPLGQRIFDNIWLLFTLSLLISGILYNLWGILELLNVPGP